MKQKLFLLLMLVVALAACTKDDDEYDDYVSEAPPTKPTESNKPNDNDSVNSINEVGNFEGEWILDQQVISQPDTIFVKEGNKSYLVYFVVPGDIPILKALEAIGMENVEYIPSNHLRHLHLNPQGISGNKTYYDLSFIDIVGMSGYNPTPAIYGELYYNVDNSKRDDYIILMSDKLNVAIYDSETGLWTLKITIRQVYLSGIYYCDLPSPLVLLFVAKKRL